MMTRHAPMLDFAGSILDLAAVRADQPRAIDQYIDYFGSGTDRAGRSEPTLATRSGHLSAPAAAAGIEPIGASGA
jgi:hypothetical protein